MIFFSSSSSNLQLMPCCRIHNIHICVPLLLSTSGGQDVLQNQHCRKHNFFSLTGSFCAGRNSKIFAYNNDCFVLQFYSFPSQEKIRFTMKIRFLYFIFFFSPQNLPKAGGERAIEAIKNSFCSYFAWEGYTSVEGRMVGIFHLLLFFSSCIGLYQLRRTLRDRARRFLDVVLRIHGLSRREEIQLSLSEVHTTENPVRCVVYFRATVPQQPLICGSDHNERE